MNKEETHKNREIKIFKQMSKTITTKKNAKREQNVLQISLDPFCIDKLLLSMGSALVCGWNTQ